MTMHRNNLLAILGLALLTATACQRPGGNSPGSEYMPDMAHPVSYEANLYDYYKFNRWGTEEELHKLMTPRLPVKGTVPRGYAGVATAHGAGEAAMHGQQGTAVNAISVPANGNVPYYYGNTEEERTRAMQEIIYNPYPITASGLEKGKELYVIYCGICHGEKGDGNGYLVSSDNLNSKYPAAPANLISDPFISATNGRYYHAIMYGKNVMGGYSDKLSYEERWQVIHYIRSLQAKEKKVQYNAEVNTLNDSLGMPELRFKAVMAANHPAVEAAPVVEEATHSTEGEHSGSHH